MANITTLAVRAVQEIIDDLTDRRGLKQEWHQMDAEIQDEIRETWIGLIEDTFAAGPIEAVVED